MKSENFPKIYKDKLGRVIYVLENEFERVAFTYYGSTKKIKIKYHYMNENFYIDAFSKNGKLIFSTFSKNVYETNVEKKIDGTIDFIVSSEKLKAINLLK